MMMKNVRSLEKDGYRYCRLNVPLKTIKATKTMTAVFMTGFGSSNARMAVHCVCKLLHIASDAIFIENNYALE
jgi:hypothetical protein